MAQPRVFISHASPDMSFANRLAEDLRGSGADAWLDSSHMASGDFVARINDALANRDVVVLVLSPAAIQSSWVSQEFNAAIARTQQGLMRPPIVVMARPCRVADIPPLWTVYHRYDASNDYQGALHGVARELGLNTPTPVMNAMASARPGRAARMPRSPSGRWSPSYVMTAIAAAIALICLLWFGAGNLYVTAPEMYGLPLVLAFAFGAGGWLAAAIQMSLLKQWVWLGLLLIGALCYITGLGVGYHFFIRGGYVSGLAALEYILPIGTLVTAFFGPTVARKGS